MTTKKFSADQQNIKQTISRLVIISNALLYILFIIIVIAYQYSQPKIASGNPYALTPNTLHLHNTLLHQMSLFLPSYFFVSLISQHVPVVTTSKTTITTNDVLSLLFILYLLHLYLCYWDYYTFTLVDACTKK